MRITPTRRRKLQRLCTGLYFLLLLGHVEGCTSPAGVFSAAKDDTSQPSTVVPSVAPLEPATLPLAPSSAQPPSVGNANLPFAVAAGGIAPPINTNADQNLSLPQQSNGQAPATPEEPKDSPILQGDLTRFRYAFFAQTVADYGSTHRWPFIGVVFTEDPNFCTRDAAPIHVSDFTMYQVASEAESHMDPNTIYNTITDPALLYWMWADEMEEPEFSNVLGFRTTCYLFGLPRGGASFREASWSLSPKDANSIDTASTLAVSIHARNNVQEISWTRDAKRCDAALKYFQNYGGNHFFPQQIDCVRTSVDPAKDANAMTTQN